MPACRACPKHSDAWFVGAKFGEDLARRYVAGDVFVFPSRTDYLWLGAPGALASGLPVAAYPVPRPLDVIGDSGFGWLCALPPVHHPLKRRSELTSSRSLLIVSIVYIPTSWPSPKVTVS
jgi:hypothetical protein